MKRFMLKNPICKPLLIWTNEPRLSTVNKDFYKPFFLLSKVHLMNVYTGNVFTSNTTYQQKRFMNNKKLDFLDNSFNFKNRKVVALMSYYNAGINSSLFIDNENIDLVRKRSLIGIYGHKNNFLDIYGSGWPKNMAKENSRLGNWVSRKSEILANYNINLCFENTVYPKYITEKIWDSIENHCLPIYYGGSRSSIYEIFPKDSFIDYANFENPEKLFDFINSLSKAEYISRLNKCITVYNSFIHKPITFWEENKQVLLNKIVKKIKYLSK